MGRIEERAGIPVPRRVQLLEADVDRVDGRHRQHVEHTDDRFEELRDEMRRGRESNNRLLLSILVALIVALGTQLALLRFG